MTSTQIAARLGMATSTACAVLARLGFNRLSRLEPLEPPNRYCRDQPGVIHIDIKARSVRPARPPSDRLTAGAGRGPDRQGRESTRRSRRALGAKRRPAPAGRWRPPGRRPSSPLCGDGWQRSGTRLQIHQWVPTRACVAGGERVWHSCARAGRKWMELMAMD